MQPRQGTFTGDLSPFRAALVMAFIVLLAPARYSRNACSFP